MSGEDEATDMRIHIGNISPRLAEKKTDLSLRLAKFGEIVKELELRSKPNQDFYFGFITLSITSKNYEKLKNTLNGILYMGLKLTIGVAKESFQERWLRDSKRPDVNQSERLKRENISKARAKRIEEANSINSVNSITRGLIFSTNVGPNNSSLGYMKSSHTYHDMSANTKHKAPPSSLVGTNSYGSLTYSAAPFAQQYSKVSGGSEVIQGRHRINKRPYHHFLKREQSLRILINGELKTIKCYKTKLWGMEKNKTSMDLTWKYVNGAWKSGDDHVIERTKVITDNVNNGVTNVLCGLDNEESQGHGKNKEKDDEELSLETMQNKSVLASLFGSINFDKPVELDVDDNGIDKEDIIYDSKGRRKVIRHDYEINGILNNSESDSDDMANINEGKILIENYMKSSERPQREVYFDEEDDGNDLDLDDLGTRYSTEAIIDKYDDDHRIEIASSEKKENDSSSKVTANLEPIPEPESEDEFIPTFGAPGAANNTETLRSLFNPETSKNGLAEKGGFKLALSDEEDIEEQNVLDLQNQEEILNKIKMKQQEESIRENSKQFGLFWSHLDSPFLQSQSQLSKIGDPNDIIILPGESLIENSVEGEESQYEQWFWKMRGEVSRECKRRKRDVLRVFKKKSSTFASL